MFIEHKKEAELKDNIWVNTIQLLKSKQEQSYLFNNKYGKFNIKKLDDYKIIIEFLNTTLSNLDNTGFTITSHDYDSISIKSNIIGSSIESIPNRDTLEILFEIISIELKKEKFKALEF